MVYFSVWGGLHSKFTALDGLKDPVQNSCPSLFSSKRCSGTRTCAFAPKKAVKWRNRTRYESGLGQESFKRAEVVKEPRGAESCQPNYLDSS